MSAESLPIYLHNSMGRRTERLAPLSPGRIGLYVCGVTVYDRCHLGHARVMVLFDALVRFLRQQDYTVNYVRNITDIDDRILERAAAAQEPWQALAQRYIDAAAEDEQRLGLLVPDQMPRATHNMPQIIAMIERLFASGHAYRADNGDIYFAVERSLSYGRLSGRRPDELLAGARVAIEKAKRDPRDFALWKSVGNDAAQVGWDSPWGRGRPGWHIECSAMSTACLGASFDIHGGGPDLLFPHHENEIAQSEAATGKVFAKHWIHVGPVQAGADKMSKSLGNFYTIHEALDKHGSELVRWWLLSGHYRSPLDYVDGALSAERASLQRLYNALERAPAAQPAPLDAQEPWTRLFLAALADDFNVPEARAVLFGLARSLNRASGGELLRQACVLRSLGAVLGLLGDDPVAFRHRSRAEGQLSEEEIAELLAARRRAREAGDYAAADAIREQLAGRGVSVEDGAGETRWRRAEPG